MARISHSLDNRGGALCKGVAAHLYTEGTVAALLHTYKDNYQRVIQT